MRLKKTSQVHPKIKYVPPKNSDDDNDDNKLQDEQKVHNKDNNEGSDLEFEEESSQDELEDEEETRKNEEKQTTVDFDDEEEVHFDGDKMNDDEEEQIPVPSYYELGDKFAQALANAHGSDSDSDAEGAADDEGANNANGNKRRVGPSMREQRQEKFLTRLNKKKSKFDTELKPMLESMRNGLGTLDGKIFYHSKDCVPRLHRLKEAVTNDESLDRAVWRQLAEWKIVQNELMNIVACNRRYSHDNNNQEMLFAAVSLMVTMTQPPKHLSDIITHKRVAKKRERFHLRDQYRILQEMKLGFLLRNSISSLMETLIPGDDETLDNNFLLETKQSSSLLSYEEYTMLVIQLLVNLLKIPDAKSNVLSSNDQISQMHELMIKQMDETRMLTFINALIQKLFIKYDAKVSKNNFTRSKVIEWYFQCLQFICLVINSETPEGLFAAEKALSRPIAKSSSSTTRTASAPKASDHDQAMLRKLLSAQQEQEENQEASLSSRHSRFGSYFITPLSQSNPINDDDDDQETDNPMKEVKKMLQPNTVKVVRQIFTADNPLLGEDVVIARQVSVRERIRDPYYSNLNIRTQQILKDFLFVFYKHSFNSFFERIWESILYQRESILTQEANDNTNHEANFLFLGAFMLDFNRHSFEHHKEISERLSTVYVRDISFDISSIAAVIELPELIQHLFDRVVNFAYETKDWNTLTQSAYFLKEFVLCLHIMFQQKGPKRDYVQIASAMLHKILYEPKRIECIPRMIRLFEPSFLPRHYLTNMVELVHYLLEVLQSNEEEKFETFYTKKQSKKKKGTTSNDGEEQPIPVEDEKLEQYDSQIEFDLERFKRKFATASSVRPYMLLLEDYILNSPEVNSYILDMIKLVAEECDSKLLFFNVLTLTFFSKVLSKANDLYPHDKAEIQMTKRERTNKRMIELILSLVRDWRAMLLNDTVFSKHHHVEAWFLKTKKGVSILKGEDSDVEEEVYSDSERKSRRQNKRKQGLSSEVFSEHEDVYPTSAGEDVGPVARIRMARDIELDNILGSTNNNKFSLEEGEEEYEFDSQQQEESQEPAPKPIRRKRKKTSSETSSKSSRAEVSEDEEKPKAAKKRKVAPASDSDNEPVMERVPSRRRKRKHQQQEQTTEE